MLRVKLRQTADAAKNVALVDEESILLVLSCRMAACAICSLFSQRFEVPTVRVVLTRQRN